jgi:hypothetical protein
MALSGLPSGSNGEAFLDRIQYDAKAGRWHAVSRKQDAAGAWISDMIPLNDGDAFAMDMENIEVGWIAFAATGPDFKMVPNGQSVGPKPTDQHKAGFRVKVLLRGETAPRYFASTAKAVLGVIDELHTIAAATPGVPVVRIKGTRLVETKGPAGTTRNYAPLLEIVQHIPRPAPLVAGATPSPAPQPTPQPAPTAAPAAGGWDAPPPPSATGAAIGDAMPF